MSNQLIKKNQLVFLKLRNTIRKIALSVLGLTTATTILAVTWSEQYRDKFTLICAGIFRSTATLAVWYELPLNKGYKSEEYKAAQKVVHLCVAKRLLNLCKLHTGIYIKGGQHLASLTFIIPKEYTDTLSILQDRAPYRNMDDVKKIFYEQFNGLTPKDLFSEFDEIPLAAASLAQVHKAKTKYGDEVAVKVQYPDVYRLFNVDIWTMQTIFRHHANEMSIPKIYWDLTTKRILTMEFIHGVKINDIDGLKKIGADPNWVRNILLEIFAEMIFCHGVIHCDPHPGNALVTISPKTKKPQIVLLDHGLYRELSDDFRKTYCDLWKALVLNDSNALKVVSESLGVPQYIQFLPLIFAQRISDSSTPLGEDMSLEEKNIVRDQLHNITLSDFFDFLEALPRDMLLVFRTINLVRGIHRQLGGSSIESFKMNAYYAIRGSWCETREEEFSRVDHANKLGIKGDESMIGPVHKWYLFGSTPNFARSLGFIKDLIVLTVRIYMAEIAIRIWRWCHRIHNLNDYIDDDDDTNKGTWATDGIIAPPKIASSAVQMYDYMG
ncbi:15152_t:CDS:10 [Entrophospora sp. SA101]|nr:15152_t:CDS:10 [Entrophospora sp. SA101]